VSDSLKRYEHAVRRIKDQLRVQQQQHKAALAEQDVIIAQLREQVAAMTDQL